MATKPADVAIIGAGLAGTALGLALHRKGIKCRIYEARSPDAHEFASGVILTPNGLHVLDELGVLERIKHICWKSYYRTVRNDKDEIVRKTLIANGEKYGYENHRLYRRTLLDEMKAMLRERDVPITYNAKFDGIVSEDENGDVKFLINGKQESTTLLLGADGINSSIRLHLQPDAVPEFTGVIGVIAHIKWDAVQWPFPGYERACTLQGKAGAIFWIPEYEDGSEIMVGKQVQRPEISRAEWEAEAMDKEKLCDFYREGYDTWNDTGRGVIDAVCANKESLYLWPFLRVPVIQRWFSTTGGIILVGDAAHALPPSTGQGINQALEDVYALSILLDMHRRADTGTVADRMKALDAWKEMRQERIDRVFDWATNHTNVERMSAADRERVVREGKTPQPANPDDMSWLYMPVTEQDIAARILSRVSKN